MKWTVTAVAALMLILSTRSLMAQNEIPPGDEFTYIVLNSGDTVEVYIKKQSAFIRTREILATDARGSKRSFRPGEIQGFSFQGIYYASLAVDARGKNMEFLQQVQTGALHAYLDEYQQYYDPTFGPLVGPGVPVGGVGVPATVTVQVLLLVKPGTDDRLYLQGGPARMLKDLRAFLPDFKPLHDPEREDLMLDLLAQEPQTVAVMYNRWREETAGN